jgi:phosphoglucosamine mutase
VTLSFGTDGVRGVAGTDLTPELVTALGRAIGITLDRPEELLVARDTRRSGPMLEAALTAGLCAEGVTVTSLGVLPTPALALACRHDGRPGVMISASHNPYPDNGLKVFTAGGHKLDDAQEAAVEAHLAALAAGATRRPARTGAAIAGARRAPAPRAPYLDHLTRAVAPDALAGLSVVVDCAHGAAYLTAPKALRDLGAQVTAVNVDPDGTNINDRCGSTHPAAVAEAVVRTGADVGVAFDGDADRVIAVDERGRVVDGDHLLAIMALDLAAAGRLRHETVVTTVMANLGLRRALEPRGIRVLETPVGDRHVLAAMRDGGFVLGGEQSGHLIFAEHAPTGDGPLAAVLLLDVMARRREPLSHLAAVVTKLPQEQRNVAFPDPSRLAGAEAFWAQVAAVEAELDGDGRVLVRPSGTEPVVRVMVEAARAEQAAAAADRLAAALAALAD